MGRVPLPRTTNEFYVSTKEEIPSKSRKFLSNILSLISNSKNKISDSKKKESSVHHKRQDSYLRIISHACFFPFTGKNYQEGRQITEISIYLPTFTNLHGLLKRTFPNVKKLDIFDQREIFKREYLEFLPKNLEEMHIPTSEYDFFELKRMLFLSLPNLKRVTTTQTWDRNRNGLTEFELLRHNPYAKFLNLN